MGFTFSANRSFYLTKVIKIKSSGNSSEPKIRIKGALQNYCPAEFWNSVKWRNFMYKIERKTSGYLLTFGGTIEADEMQRWYDESVAALKTAPETYGVIVDMRTLSPLAEKAREIMVAGQQLYKEAGMERSAVILANSFVTTQFKMLAVKSGIYAYERYIDATANPDWARKAKEWVVRAIDPDKED
jgi:hypothetical protein